MRVRLTAGPGTGRPSRADLNVARVLIVLALFSIAFAFVEAAVVVYLRSIYEPIHQRLYPDRGPTDLFPILRLDDLKAAGPKHVGLLYTELVREAATLLMLAAFGFGVATKLSQCTAGFMIAFGVWDIFFYVFLKLLVDWPESLATWDLLFLIPVPWVGPVWSPVLVSILMIAAGVVILWRESNGKPMRFTWPHVVTIGTGGLAVIITFCWDWRNIVSGGEPNPFQWPLFGLGLGVGLGSFFHAAWKS